MNQRCHLGSTRLNSASRGAVLLVCLLLLAALTFLGLAAAWSHILQERMSSNLEQSKRSAQVADSALAWGEEWLMGLQITDRPVPCPANCGASQVIRSKGAVSLNTAGQGLAWWVGNGHVAGIHPQTGAVLDEVLAAKNPPAYWVIEEVFLDDSTTEDGLVTGTGFYRLLARGSASGSHEYAVTESIVARPWGNTGLTNGFPAMNPVPGFCRLLNIVTPCGRQAWRKLH